MPTQDISSGPNTIDALLSLIESTRNKSFDKTDPTNTNNNNINNNTDCPDYDNNNDVVCFPWQDKELVLPQDISPNATNALTRLIASTTDKSTPMIHPHNSPQWQQEHRQLQAMFPQFVTAHVAAPSLIPIYANDRPISTWNGTTHTDIVYDDDNDYDGRTDYDYAYGDSLIWMIPPSDYNSKSAFKLYNSKIASKPQKISIPPL